MTNRFLISVAAAALIAGTGLANAQGMGRDSGSAGSAAQQSAPSSDRGGASSGGAMQRDSGGNSGMKGESGMTKGESGMKAEFNRQVAACQQERAGWQPDAGREVEEHELWTIRPRAARK